MDTVKMGSLLKQLRKEHGMTQEQLAEKLGVTNRTVSRWEVGSNMPDIDIIIDLSELYQIEIKDLLNGEKKNTVESTEENKEKADTARQLAKYNGTQEAHRMRKICFVAAFGVAALGLLFYTTLNAFANVTSGSIVGLFLSAAFMIYNIVMQAFPDSRSTVGYQFTLISGFIATIISNILILMLFLSRGSYYNYGLKGLLYVLAIVIIVFITSAVITIALIKKSLYKNKKRGNSNDK